MSIKEHIVVAVAVLFVLVLIGLGVHLQYCANLGLERSPILGIKIPYSETDQLLDEAWERNWREMKTGECEEGG